MQEERWGAGVCVCVCKMVAFHKDDLKFLKDERSSVVIQ